MEAKDYNILLEKIEKAFNKIAQECVVEKHGNIEFDKVMFYNKAFHSFENILKSSKVATTILSFKDIKRIISSFKVQTQVTISKKYLKNVLKT